MKHRKRIQQPWSLLLQLLSLLFLVIALAGPRLGSDQAGRDHVLIIDTSAWMGARAGRTTLIDEARAGARAVCEGSVVAGSGHDCSGRCFGYSCDGVRV